MEADNLPPEAVSALCDLYLKFWHDTGGYEADDPKYTLTPNSDLADLAEICERIEPHEKVIRALVAPANGNGKRLAH